MIFVMDVGNTNIKCGFFEQGELRHSFRLATDLEATSDEYGVKLLAFTDHLGIRPEEVEGIIVSSVIPSINYTIEHMGRLYFHQKPHFVEPGIRTGINICYDNPKELGADRIVNAVAAYELFGGPVIVIDFGTATTFGAISESGDFLGGAICTGLRISAEALTNNTAKLPRIELVQPGQIINRTTVSSMQAGIIYGYVGQVRYIVSKMREEIGPARVIATGGFSQLMAEQTDVIDEVVPTLTLQGLERIYQKNIREWNRTRKEDRRREAPTLA
ncbi:MAG: type III pantothenate kinase [Clostridia bacterium]|nr:type III pantothenate kinase [Clostridia bacterium]